MGRTIKSKNPSTFNAQTRVTSVDEWLEHQSKKDLLRFITCGSVDDGKSTLIGRLLWESNQIFDDQLASLQADSSRHGTQGSNIDFALLLDGLAAEREQGITIDVAYRFFSTPKRKFIVADTPGHEQYTRNMVTGASTADLAVILVNASQGILTQTRRHAYLASLMGIQHVVLAVNKMDLVKFNEAVFNRIKEDFNNFAMNFGFNNIIAIPLSALRGDNITTPSNNTSWYQGPTLIGHLENVNLIESQLQNFIFPVQCVSRPNAEFRGFSGSVSSGQIAVGDKVRVTSSGQVAKVKRIVTMDGDKHKVQVGEAVTIALDREIDASRGDVFSKADQPLQLVEQFEAILFWMHEEFGLVGRNYDIKLANQWAGASINTIKHRININTQADEPCRKLSLNDIALCNIAVSKPMVVDAYMQSKSLGGFILIDKFSHATIAAGMVTNKLLHRQNIHQQALTITREKRERLNGHKGKVIWLTGLSGSGKSTIANALEKELYAEGKRTYILDGDNVRQGLNKDLGFTDADRVENIRRVAEVAKLMMDSGLIVLTAFISPFRAEREMARKLIGEDNFIEIYVNTPLKVCEERDPKGLYKKARDGLLPNMTGITSPYEEPIRPNLSVGNDNSSIDAIVKDLLILINKTI